MKRIIKGETKEQRQARCVVCMEIAEDFPDGAFFGYMLEENGFDVEELPSWDEKLRKYVFPGEKP